MHEQHVGLGAACDRLVNRPAEQALEEAAVAAADDDQVGVALVGHVKQPLARRRLPQPRRRARSEPHPSVGPIP